MITEYLRPIFYVTLLFSFIIMLSVIMQKKSAQNKVNVFYIFILSIFSIILSGITLFQNGKIADETGNAGDVISFYLFIAVIIINVLNIVFSLVSKSTYKND